LGLGVVKVFFGENFKSYVATQASVLRFVDDTHASTADFLNDFVVMKGLSQHGFESLLLPQVNLPAKTGN
jgi:hypothetical protein